MDGESARERIRIPTPLRGRGSIAGASVSVPNGWGYAGPVAWTAAGEIHVDLDAKVLLLSRPVYASHQDEAFRGYVWFDRIGRAFREEIWGEEEHVGTVVQPTLEATVALAVGQFAGREARFHGA